MRIIGGKYRGRTLKTFDGKDVRPTSDRAREALFNILQFRIAGCSFYDGFGGSGAVGFEACSRGAKSVVITDSSKESVLLCKANAKFLGADAEIKQISCENYLETTLKKFDVVFLDPPYALDSSNALKIISQKGVLSDGGIVVLEKDRAGDSVDGLKITSVRKYGKAVFTFYEADKEQTETVKA